MDHEEISHIMREKAVGELQKWLIQQDFNLFLTLNFNDGDVTLRTSRSAVKKFLAKVDRAILGRKFHRKPQQDRTFMVAFLENTETNIHYHSLLRVNDCNFLHHAEKAWQEVIPSGDIFVAADNESNLKSSLQPLSNGDVGRIAEYVTKQTAREKNYENFLLSKEFIFAR